jgi:outer membrane protein TolC
MKKFIVLSFLMGWFYTVSLAQNEDSTSVVNFEAFMEIVWANHPVSKQANLRLASGEANTRKARGSFDPVLKSEYNYKQYGGKEYYRINNNELKLPTSLGMEVKAGYENNQGVYLNPEATVPANGLAYAGIAMPLGSGLFFDERRQAVRQAEVFERSTELERTLMLNELTYEASKAYWNWFVAWNTHRIYEEAVRLAEVRLAGIKQSFLNGELPAIDTLEASILVQSRELSRNDAWIKLAEAKYQMDNFLWSESLAPLTLNDGAKPAQINSEELLSDVTFSASAMDNIDAEHPQIRLYANKIEQLNFDRRMKAEKVKPKLNVNYNFLNEPVGGNPGENFSINNYKWGFDFSMPLLLRKGRGDLQLSKIKIENADLAMQQKSIEIKNKIRAYRTELNTLKNQIALFKSTVANYRSLLAGERRKFEEGESSLFLVNSRESGLISADIKLVELQGKYNKALAGLIQAIGRSDLDM